MPRTRATWEENPKGFSSSCGIKITVRPRRGWLRQTPERHERCPPKRASVHVKLKKLLNAAGTSDVDKAIKAIEAGANVHTTDKDGHTPLDKAIQHENKAVVRVLVLAEEQTKQKASAS